MGERALAAVSGESHLDVYYAHWGGSDDCLAQILRAAPAEQFQALTAVDWQFRGRSNPATFPDHIDSLDIDAVYLVSTRGVTVYLPVWLGFSLPTDGPMAGVLVRVETMAECRALRATVQFLKGVLHEALALDWLDSEVARDLFALAVRTYCTPERVYTPGTPLRET